MNRIEANHITQAAMQIAATAIAEATTKANNPWESPLVTGAPDLAPMATPVSALTPMPPEAPQPMSLDNGRAVGHAMHMLATAQVQSTQALVLTQLRPPEAHESKRHDHRREHRSTTLRPQEMEVDDTPSNLDDSPAPMSVLCIADSLQAGLACQRTLQAAQRIFARAASLLTVAPPAPSLLGRLRP